jgi:hypothetical protein
VDSTSNAVWRGGGEGAKESKSEKLALISA